MTNKLVEQVTMGGRIAKLNPTLNDAKLARADQIIEGLTRNDGNAVAAFREHLGARFGETLTTGDDFIHAFAQLAAFEVVDEWEAEDRDWAEVIPVETISSWETPVTYYVDMAVEGFERPQNEPDLPGDTVPIVPEGSTYPSFMFKGEASESGGIHKAGGQFALTFERIVADSVGLVPKIPMLIRESLLNRENWDAWNGLIKFIDVPANHLAAGTTIDGTPVAADAPLGLFSVALALEQAQLREIRGKKVKVGTYDLLVPTGTKTQAEFLLYGRKWVEEDQTSGLDTRRFEIQGFNPLSKLAKIVETDFLEDQRWALVPSKGSIRGRNKFYAYTRLIGQEGPELRIQNLTGNYLGGGIVPPFEGSFDTDSAAFRGRIIGDGIGWNSEYAVISDGDGVVTP